MEGGQNADAPRPTSTGDVDSGRRSGAEPEDAGDGLEPETHARRVPHPGHALLFVCFAFLVLELSELVLALFGRSPAAMRNGAITVEYPKLQLAALGATYLVTLLAAWFFYPVLWTRSFLEGIRWNWAEARRLAGRLIPLGLVLGATVQAATYFVTSPKTLPINDFFATATDAWVITVFGTLVAPVFEEVCFRGFLVPAIAIAYDWLSLPRTPAARASWRTSTALSHGGLLFSAIFTSVLFALLHAEQVDHVWTLVAVLFSVSLVLTFVRVKTQSVAASAMVHGAYNFFVFLLAMIATGGYRHLDRMTR